MTQQTRPEGGTRLFGFKSDVVKLSRHTKEKLVAKFPDSVDADCESISCPAKFAGYAPSEGDESYDIAKTYDYVVGERVKRGDYSRADGDDIITEEVAKESWLDAIAALRTRGKPGAAEVGETIATELGWLDQSAKVHKGRYPRYEDDPYARHV